MRLKTEKKYSKKLRKAWNFVVIPIRDPSAVTKIVLNLRWLDWIFWGWYLPSLSINYVGMSKDIEKRLPQQISYDLGFIVIGVTMAT